MSLKETGPATEWREIDRFEAGAGWIAHPDETMRRASHALAVDGDVWVIDPVDADGIDDLLADLGEVAGVVVLLDRHTRDAGAIARRHDVSVWVPDAIAGVVSDVDAPTERFHRDLADTGYAVHEVVDTVGWHEVALYGEDTGVLVLADALGTAPYFRTGDERLGVHPMLRMLPPRKLTRLNPKRILVGHGEGVHENAGVALSDALDGARRRAPRLYWQSLKAFLPV